MTAPDRLRVAVLASAGLLSDGLLEHLAGRGHEVVIVPRRAGGVQRWMSALRARRVVAAQRPDLVLTDLGCAGLAAFVAGGVPVALVVAPADAAALPASRPPWHPAARALARAACAVCAFEDDALRLAFNGAPPARIRTAADAAGQDPSHARIEYLLFAAARGAT